MRTIRSFVRRAGRLTAPQQGALVELWPIYGIELKEELLDLDEIFGRRAERVLDIGFGNGDALIFSTQENPEQDFIGIEVHKPGMGHCLLMARASGISNLRLIQHDAVEVLQNQIPNGAIKRINLLFPDPWPKKRHHKRRLLQHTPHTFIGLTNSMQNEFIAHAPPVHKAELAISTTAKHGFVAQPRFHGHTMVVGVQVNGVG